MRTAMKVLLLMNQPPITEVEEETECKKCGHKGKVKGHHHQKVPYTCDHCGHTQEVELS